MSASVQLNKRAASLLSTVGGKPRKPTARAKPQLTDGDDDEDFNRSPVGSSDEDGVADADLLSLEPEHGNSSPPPPPRTTFQKQNAERANALYEASNLPNGHAGDHSAGEEPLTKRNRVTRSGTKRKHVQVEGPTRSPAAVVDLDGTKDNDNAPLFDETLFGGSSQKASQRSQGKTYSSQSHTHNLFTDPDNPVYKGGSSPSKKRKSTNEKKGNGFRKPAGMPPSAEKARPSFKNAASLKRTKAPNKVAFKPSRRSLRHQNAVDTSEDPNAVDSSLESAGSKFKHPTSSQNLASSASSPLSSPPESLDDGDIVEEIQLDLADANNTPPDSPTKARCPLCKALVDRVLLDTHTRNKRMKHKDKVAFCALHQKLKLTTGYGEQNPGSCNPMSDSVEKPTSTSSSARNVSQHPRSQREVHWEGRKYPTIDWNLMPARLEGRNPHILSLLVRSTGLSPDRPKRSHYREVLNDKLLQPDGLREVRNAFHNPDSSLHRDMMPGYYGVRGMQEIQNHVLTNFGDVLRDLVLKDDVAKILGDAGYVQCVVVPEVASWLVIEDFGFDEVSQERAIEQARRILQESADVGGLLNPEEAEHVDRNSDMDNLEEERGAEEDSEDEDEGREDDNEDEAQDDEIVTLD